MLSVQIIPPFSGIAHLSFGLSASSWTMSPDQAIARGEVALRERLRVVVAGEPADLARVDGRLDRSIAASNVSSVTFAGSSPFVEHARGRACRAISFEHRHLALELRVLEQLRRSIVTGPGELLVPRDARHARTARAASTRGSGRTAGSPARR